MVTHLITWRNKMTELKNYRVKLTHLYSDTIEVEATTREEAIEMAQGDANGEFECFYNVEVTEL